MVKVTGASVRWFQGWANSPSLVIQIDNDSPIRASEPIWRFVEAEEVGRYVVTEVPIDTPDEWTAPNHNAAGWVALDQRSAPLGGALGGRFALANGGEVISPGGWSSRAGVLNQYRDLFELSDYVLDISWKTPLLQGMLLSGACTLAVAQRAVRTFLPDVYLVEEVKWEGEIYFISSTEPHAVVKPNDPVLDDPTRFQR